MSLRNRRLPALLTLVAFLEAPALFGAASGLKVFPLQQVRAGMKGTAYTIFAGDQIVKMDLDVLGILPNALGPKQDIILVELHGPEVEHAGVVAGMSGSPVYIEGKLAGALSLKLGVFTKEAIAGVTPIENMLDVDTALPPAPRLKTEANNQTAAGSLRVPLGTEWARHAGLSGEDFLVPIDTPLVFSGVYPRTLAEYSKTLSGYNMTLMEGGSVPPSSDDAKIQPGDMVGMQLIRGDLSLSAGCTVTAVIEQTILACGHPLFGFGPVQMPLARAHVITTVASSMSSIKIINTGGVIGTLTQDRLTAVLGRLGAGPPMIPLDVTLSAPPADKHFHFRLVQNPQLTPLLVGLATFNGLVGNTAYSADATLKLDGAIEIRGHTPVRLVDMFVPSDAPIPEGFFVATAVQSIFARIFTNPYETPKIEKISLRVTSVPQRRLAVIDNAWSEKSEVRPGETIGIKVLLRPYRGAPFIQEVPIHIPPQTPRGALRVLVSDAETLNRMGPLFLGGPQGQLPGLEELIRVLNRERRNDRLYATLLQPAPTLLVEDKELPNVPLSEMNILDQRQNFGGTRLLWESAVGEASVEMNQVISGQRYLTLQVK